MATGLKKIPDAKNPINSLLFMNTMNANMRLKHQSLAVWKNSCERVKDLKDTRNKGSTYKCLNERNG